MNQLLEAVTKFLESADFEVTRGHQPPVLILAQNESLIVFVLDASGDLQSTIDTTLGLLIKPFRTKAFGPKTLEMYAVFLCDTAVPTSEIEQYEQNTMVCRKIVLTSVDEIPTRLSFLKPLEAEVSSTPDIEQMFWAELGNSLSPKEMELLVRLKDRTIALDEVINTSEPMSPEST
jgi:hypothetical protein